jgi:hypothetical protein
MPSKAGYDNRRLNGTPRESARPGEAIDCHPLGHLLLDDFGLIRGQLTDEGGALIVEGHARASFPTGAVPAGTATTTVEP